MGYQIRISVIELQESEGRISAHNAASVNFSHEYDDPETLQKLLDAYGGKSDLAAAIFRENLAKLRDEFWTEMQRRKNG